MSAEFSLIALSAFLRHEESRNGVKGYGFECECIGRKNQFRAPGNVYMRAHKAHRTFPKLAEMINGTANRDIKPDNAV